MVGIPHANQLKIPDPKLEAHAVSKKTIETPRKHTPRTNTRTIRRILAKGNKRLILLKRIKRVWRSALAQTKTLSITIQTHTMMKKITYLMRNQMPVLPQRLPQLSLAVLQCRTCLVYFTSNKQATSTSAQRQLQTYDTNRLRSHPKRFLRTSLKLHHLRPHLPYARLLIRRFDLSQEISTGYMGLEDGNTPTGTASFTETEELFSPRVLLF